MQCYSCLCTVYSICTRRCAMYALECVHSVVWLTISCCVKFAQVIQLISLLLFNCHLKSLRTTGLQKEQHCSVRLATKRVHTLLLYFWAMCTIIYIQYLAMLADITYRYYYNHVNINFLLHKFYVPRVIILLLLILLTEWWLYIILIWLILY